MIVRRNRQPQLLDQYWKSLRHDHTATPPPELDPTMATFTSTLASLSRELQPPAGQLDTIWNRVATTADDPVVWSPPERRAAEDARRLPDTQLTTTSAVNEEAVSMSDTTSTPHDVPFPKSRRRELLQLAAAIVAFIAIGSVLVLALRNDDPQSEVAVPGPTATPVTTVSPTATVVESTQPTTQSEEPTEPPATPTSPPEASPPAAGQIVATIPVGTSPANLVVSEGSIWVPNLAGGTLTRVDATTNQVAATIAIGPAGVEGVPSPEFVAVLDGQIWVNNDAEQQLVRVDPVTNQVVDRVPLPDGSDLSGMVAADGSLWVSDLTTDQVLRIDPSNGSVLASFAVRGAGLMSAGAGAVWVASIDRAVARLDPATNEIAATVTLSDRITTVTFGAGSVWAAGFDTGTVFRIDPATNSLADSVFTSATRSRSIVASDSEVWIASFVPGGLNVLVRIDIETSEVSQPLETLPILGLAQADGVVWAASFDVDSSNAIVESAVLRIEPSP